MCFRLGEMILSLQDNTQVVMGEPALGILRQRVPPKRLNILINWRLLPREQSENEDWNTQSDRAHDWIRKMEPAATRSRHADQTKAGQVLPMIGDVRKLKRVAVHEPEDRRQRNNESNCCHKRPLPDSPAQSPQKRQPSK